MDRRETGSVKAAVNMYGDRIFDAKLARINKSHSNSLPESNPNPRELHLARKDINRYEESQKDAVSTEAKAELELIDAKKTVKNLASMIEDSGLQANARRRDLDMLKKQAASQEEGKTRSSYYEYIQVMQELESIKQELSNLKLNMASALDEKARAVKEAEASSSKLVAYSNSAEAITNEIGEINEEQVLAELARIEALKEFKTIKTQKMEHANEVKSHIEQTRKMANEIMQEIDQSKELENKLADVMSDIKVLQNKLSQFKVVDPQVDVSSSSSLTADCIETETPVSIQLAVNEELKEAKEALAIVKAEGFRFMSSMDLVRQELMHVIQETSKLQKKEQKTDLTIQNLSAKLLRAKAKLESVAIAEEKANGVVTDLTSTLQQLRTETEAAKKQKELMDEEVSSIKLEIQKTENDIDLDEERLQTAMDEIEAVKLSETMTLDKLKILTDNALKTRASASQNSTRITVSSFEYEYLVGRGGGAEEIADKKVAAAQAWIKALKASEKEILMRTEFAQRELAAEKSLPAKRVVEPEVVQNMGAAQPLKSNKDSAPARRARPRRPSSPAIRFMPRSSSVNNRNKKKAIPVLSKYFSKEKAIQGM